VLRIKKQSAAIARLGDDDRMKKGERVRRNIRMKEI
jgi:hypothetical protein